MRLLLDSCILGLMLHPRAPAGAARWMKGILASDEHEIIVPEIADYELRRELIRAGKKTALRKLDALAMTASFLPITSDVMRMAAELWARARNEGTPTAPPEALDGDVILAAQALSLHEDAIVVTTNVGHLSRFVKAANWHEVKV